MVVRRTWSDDLACSLTCFLGGCVSGWLRPCCGGGLWGVLGCYQEPGAQGLWARSLARVWWMVSCPLLPRSSLLLWSSCPAAMGDLSSFCFAGHAVIIVTCSLFSALGGLRTARVSWAFLCLVLAPRDRVAASNPLLQVLS